MELNLGIERLGGEESGWQGALGLLGAAGSRLRTPG